VERSSCGAGIPARLPAAAHPGGPLKPRVGLSGCRLYGSLLAGAQRFQRCDKGSCSLRSKAWATRQRMGVSSPTHSKTALPLFTIVLLGLSTSISCIPFATDVPKAVFITKSKSAVVALENVIAMEPLPSELTE
jgi:hypothetical protein